MTKFKYVVVAMLLVVFSAVAGADSHSQYEYGSVQGHEAVQSAMELEEALGLEATSSFTIPCTASNKNSCAMFILPNGARGAYKCNGTTWVYYGRTCP